MATVMGVALAARTLALVVIAAITIRASTTSGDPVEGELLGVGDSTLLVDVDGQEVPLPFDELVSAVPLDRKERTGPAIRVTLLSGSKIAAQDLSLSDEVLKIEPRRQSVVEVPLREVKSIRFRPASPATDAQWLGLLENDDRRDQLAIRRDGNQIDPAGVVIESISDGKVGFTIGGEQAAAPIARLEGVVLGGSGKVAEDAEIKIVDIYGSQFLVNAIERGDGETLNLKLTDTITHRLPTNQLYSISWTSGLVMLAGQEPAASSYKTYIETKVDSRSLAKWFGPQREGSSDLSMVGGSQIEYRIDSGFSTLAGSAGRDQSVAKAGNVAVAIFLDDREVWKQELDDSGLKGFELPLSGARRLRIEVVSGDDGDVGDAVRVIRPRLLK